MIIKNTSFEELQKEVIQEGKKIVIFGAGVLGTVTTAYILKNYQLLSLVECYVDNDLHKQKEGVIIDGHEYKVYDGSFLKEIKSDEVVLILAVSRCENLIKTFDTYENLDKCLCYVMPMMCIDNFKEDEAYINIKRTTKQMIPKTINYIWLGGKKIPRQLEKCIDSWKKYCPEYQIVRWDENNYDINTNLYTKEACLERAYGFAPDYMRLDILYRNGGIYLDTDVEIIKPLDDLLYQEAFCGIEKWQTLNFGGCSGAQKGSKAIKAFLDARENIHFKREDGSLNMDTCGLIDTRTAIAMGYKLNGKLQNLSGMTIYPYDFFHPYDYMSGRLHKTCNTFSIHHFNGGWLNEELRKENELIAEKYTLLEKRASNFE